MGNALSSGGVEAATIKSSTGFGFTVLDRGAALQRIDVPTSDGIVNCVLGYPEASGYLTDAYYAGAIIGRYANRICKGQVVVDGVAIQLDANETHTGNCLHGGREGFHSKRWLLARNEREQSIRCTLSSPDSDQGFPGNLSVCVKYQILSNSALSVELFAETDAPTIINLAHHPYFNLDQEDSSIDGHQLCVNADTYTPTDDKQIPSGEIRSVAGSIFDFRDHRSIDGVRLDENFVLNSSGNDLALAAELFSPQSRIRLRLRTTQPGLQVYTADHLAGPFSPRDGIALEAQDFPDAPNHPAFPLTLLLPGREYRHQTVYEFEVL